MTANEEFLETAEAAKVLKVHPATLLRYVRAGRVSVAKLSRKIFRFRLSDLEQFVDGRA
jgi:excisionase family DNA binding protein